MKKLLLLTLVAPLLVACGVEKTYFACDGKEESYLPRSHGLIRPAIVDNARFSLEVQKKSVAPWTRENKAYSFVTPYGSFSHGEKETSLSKQDNLFTAHDRSDKSHTKHLIFNSVTNELTLQEFINHDGRSTEDVLPENIDIIKHYKMSCHIAESSI